MHLLTVWNEAWTDVSKLKEIVLLEHVHIYMYTVQLPFIFVLVLSPYIHLYFKRYFNIYFPLSLTWPLWRGFTVSNGSQHISFDSIIDS